MSIEVCPIYRINFDQRKIVERKTFLANPKHKYRVSQRGEHDFSANNKMNEDYYGYPSLPHFIDEF